MAGAKSGWPAVWAGLLLAMVASVATLAGDEEPAADDNPYLPREGLTAEALRDFVQRMQDAPKTVQTQPGFAEAIEVAVDRILAANPSDELKAFAISNKLIALHRAAMYGDEEAQKKLSKLIDEARELEKKGLKDKEFAKLVEFFELERRAMDASLNAKTEDLPKTLEELKKYFAGEEELGTRHLRMASTTVKIINRLADDELAQRSYKEFGELWAKSQEYELSKYGKRIAKGTRKKTPEMVGKPMPIVGTTHDGKPFDIQELNGKVVLVDFWATWCGPCRELLPDLAKLYEEYHDRGLEIVGVSIDEERETLSAFVEESNMPWPTLFDTDESDPEKHPIADQYGVHGIPTLFLLDREGKVVAKNLTGEELAKKVEQMLNSKGK